MAGNRRPWLLILIIGLMLELHHAYQSRQIEQLVRDNTELLRVLRMETQAFINADAKAEKVQREENQALLNRLNGLDAALIHTQNEIAKRMGGALRTADGSLPY